LLHQPARLGNRLIKIVNSGRNFASSHEIAEKTSRDLRIFATFDALNPKEVADGISGIVRGADSGVRVTDEEVAVALHLAAVDRLVIAEAHLELLSGMAHRAILGFRLSRLVELDREPQAHHFLAKINPLRLRPSTFLEPIRAALQETGRHRDVGRLPALLSHLSFFRWFQEFSALHRCWEFSTVILKFSDFYKFRRSAKSV